MATARLFLKLHQLGWQKGDYNMGEIIRRSDGNPCLIDFSEAEKHNCKNEMEITFNEPEPLFAVPSCFELRDICADAWIFRPGSWPLLCKAQMLNVDTDQRLVTVVINGVKYDYDFERRPGPEEVWEEVKGWIHLNDIDGIERVKQVLAEFEAHVKEREELFGL